MRIALLALTLFCAPAFAATDVEGELKKWHRITLTWTGPQTSETNSSNPFRNYRLNVTFDHPASGEQMIVPGYFAADGNAAETSQASGNQWRVHFMPTQEGTWNYSVSFRTGTDIAANTNANAGSPTSFDGESGTFEILPTDKVGRDFRGKGLLHPAGHYWRFAETGEYFLKGGAGSPENFLAFGDFDSTPASHEYNPHAGDFVSGPTWKNGKGENIFGALTYLAGKGMNSVYMLTMNVDGDGDDVYPWISKDDRDRYDISKLDQWMRVFSFMQENGLAMHLLTQETENDKLLNGGGVGVERMVYYRELIARVWAYPAVILNVGEEYDVYRNDGYPYLGPIAEEMARVHPCSEQALIVVHDLYSDVYDAALEQDVLVGNSMQVGLNSIHDETLQWREASAQAGRPWAIFNDEQNPAGTGIMPDSNDANHDEPRHKALYGTLMAGGSGVAYYFGYNYAQDDLDCEDWRSRNNMWDQTRNALEFFQNYLPFWDMEGDDSLVSGSDNYCLAKPGEVYAVYLPNGGSGTTLNVSDDSYSVHWYDPRNGGNLQTGSVTQISGSGSKSLGAPPSQTNSDWLVLVRSLTKEYFPEITSCRITPNPAVQPTPIKATVTVRDRNGLDDVEAVLLLLYNDLGIYMGSFMLNPLGNGEFEFPPINLNGFPATTYSFSAVTWDEKRGWDFIWPFKDLVIQ